MSIDAIAKKIAQTPAPVLFFDTCVFLDILRVVHREQLPIGQSSAVRTLIDLSEDVNRLVWLVTCDIVLHEIDTNIDGVLRDAENEIEKRTEQRKRYIEVVKDATQVPVEHGYRGSSQALLSHFQELMNLLRSKCEILPKDKDHADKAVDRVILAKAPSSKGKNETKDCLILEVFLDLAVKLKDQAYPSPIYLVTSNSSDFGSPGEPKIKSDLDQSGTELVNNLEHARHLVTSSTDQ